MEAQLCETISCQPRVKATLRLGVETYSVESSGQGIVSEQLVSMKEQSMSILKEFITRHNVPNDVPDETEEIYSEDDDDDGETPEKVTTKSKKQRK